MTRYPEDRYPISPNLWIRRAHESDRWLRIESEDQIFQFLAIACLVATVFLDLLSRLGGTQEGVITPVIGFLFLFVILVLIPRNYPTLLSFDLSKFWLLEHRNNRIIGFAKVHRDPSSTQILLFYIAPTHRKHGLGSCLLQHVIQVEIKPIRVFTIVCEFYQRNGFRPISPEAPNVMIYEIQDSPESEPH